MKTDFETHFVIEDIINESIKVPSSSTQRIQESHITIGHIICEMIERQLRVES